MWPIVRSTPDARPGQPQTKKRKCGIQSAHQSLFTDVFGFRLLLCTIHRRKNFTMSPRGDGKPCAVCLTGDIRMGWPGRAPAPPAANAGRGHRRQGARHVTETVRRPDYSVGPRRKQFSSLDWGFGLDQLFCTQPRQLVVARSSAGWCRPATLLHVLALFPIRGDLLKGC